MVHTVSSIWVQKKQCDDRSHDSHSCVPVGSVCTLAVVNRPCLFFLRCKTPYKPCFVCLNSLVSILHPPACTELPVSQEKKKTVDFIGVPNINSGNWVDFREVSFGRSERKCISSLSEVEMGKCN